MARTTTSDAPSSAIVRPHVTQQDATAYANRLGHGHGSSVGHGHGAVAQQINAQLARQNTGDGIDAKKPAAPVYGPKIKLFPPRGGSGKTKNRQGDNSPEAKAAAKAGYARFIAGAPNYHAPRAAGTTITGTVIVVTQSRRDA